MPEIINKKIPSGNTALSNTSLDTNQNSFSSANLFLDSVGNSKRGLALPCYLRQVSTLFFEGFPSTDFHCFSQEEILYILTEIQELLTWPEGWNNYDALAPSYEAIQYAEHWIKLFYNEITTSHLDWLKPKVAASAEGEVVLEWRCSIKALTIYVGNQSVMYLKDWGADIDTEMEDGYVNSPDIRKALWKWLVG